MVEKCFALAHGDGKQISKPTTSTSKGLNERKRSKKEFRKSAKFLRKWRECKRCIRDKYGWLASFLCQPWFLQFALCAHWVLTWWISLTLRVNVTRMLEENWRRFIWKEWEVHCSNLSKRRTSAAREMGSTGYRRRKHCSLDEQRAQQTRRWRLLMDPAFKKASERGARRRRARADRLSFFLRQRYYRISSHGVTHSSTLHLSVGGANPRGGGLGSVSAVDEECSTVRFVCFPCLLSTYENDSTVIKTQRIENVKKQVCDKCKLKNNTHKPEGLYDIYLDVSHGQSEKSFLCGKRAKACCATMS